jgi:hypothetical protein
MTMHDENFCRGIAMVLQGENLKASSYVNHNSSLGLLREKMVASFVRHETPTRFAVDTGLIRDHQSGQTSRQCDLLVHEQTALAPLYRWEDFVVVHARAARAVVEVKTDLDKRCFEELLDLTASVVRVGAASSAMAPIPVFGYSLSGSSFETFVEYLVEGMATNRTAAGPDERVVNLPVVIAVQDKTYLAIRPTALAQGMPFCVCAVNLSATGGRDDKPTIAHETGLFLQFYAHVLREEFNRIHAAELYPWFNKLQLPGTCKIWISPDGKQHTDQILWS